MGQKLGDPINTVALIYENTDWGQSSAKIWKDSCKKYGMKIVLDEAYPHGSTDLTPVVIKLKKSKPDAVLNSSYISDIILFVKTMADLEFRCKAWVTNAGGETDPKFIPAVGNLGNYIMAATPFLPDLFEVKPWAREVNEGFKAMTGDDLPVVSAMAYTDLYVMAEAFERAGSRDRQKLQSTLRNIEITNGNAMLLAAEKIAFNEKGENPYQRMLIGQIIDKEWEIVYPEEYKLPGVEIVWPWPPWSDR